MNGITTPVQEVKQIISDKQMQYAIDLFKKLTPLEAGTVIEVMKNIGNIDCFFNSVEETQTQFTELGMVIGEAREKFFKNPQ
jgi:hypothetical protein